MDVRQRWRVGAGCNPVALRLSRFESFYIHHLKEYLWCFLKWYKPLIVGYLIFLEKSPCTFDSYSPLRKQCPVAGLGNFRRRFCLCLY